MKTKLFSYLSILLIAGFLLAPAAKGFGPFFVEFPVLDEPADEQAILIPADQPAAWQDLEHQTVPQGSADGTIIYEDLYLMCDDPDDATEMHVTSEHDNYGLQFNEEYDLLIENLNPEYLGTETIELECNGVPNSFMLTVEPIGNQPAVWKPLKDKKINQRSPDGTIVYKDLALQCEDPDDDETITIIGTGSTSTSHHSEAPYSLYFNDDYDLSIEDLDPEYYGTRRVYLDCNGIPASFKLTVSKGAVIIDELAEWNPLSDKTIKKGSTDGTMVYKDLALQCNDPDDDETITITSTHNNYNLYWAGYDLAISALSEEYTGTQTVLLDCNGVEAGFDLTVADTQPDEQQPEKERKQQLYIGSIHFANDIVAAGDILPITVYLENEGGSKLEDIQVSAVIQEISTRSTARLDISRSRKEKENLLLEIPADTKPGTYSIRFTFHNQDVSRVVYRDIFVV